MGKPLRRKRMRILSDKEYERMQNNGWYLVSFNGYESKEQKELKERLQKNYTIIKKYYTRTNVRGYYRTLWACK
jgi:hypothetical protein